MATYQKRGRAWRAIVRRKGKSMSATFDTKVEAEDWATKLEARILEGSDAEDAAQAVKEERVTHTVTVADLLRRYAEEISPTKRGGRWETVRLNNFIKRYPEFDRPAISFSGPDMADWRDKRLQSVSPSSVNRELCLISAVFSQAIREWRIGLTVNPCSLITKPRKPKHRTQRVSMADREAIIKKLGWDAESEPQDAKQWAALAFYIALETAMRKGEILSLTWDAVHLSERYVHLSKTKNGDERDVPLSMAAMRLFKLLKVGKPGERVVKIESGYLDRLFREARRELGLMHVRFHDCRREAATTMAPKLSNVLELSAITGHKSLQMLKIYFAPKPSDLAAKLD